MKRMPLSLAAAVLAALTLCSCAGTRDSSWSPEWQARIGHVKLMPSRMPANAYEKPSGVDTGTADYVGSRVYMASGGDNVVGLVGGLVSSGIAHGQQSDFEEKNRSHFASLQQFFDAPFRNDLDRQLSQALDRTSLRAKRSEPYASVLYADIEKCGFIRAGVNHADEVLLTPFVRMNFLMLSTDGKKKYLMHPLLFDAAAEGIKYTARDLASDPALRKRAQEVITAKIGTAFTELLKRKLAES